MFPELEMRRAVEFELEAICGDDQFRSSHRNCAFIRYVVTETLAGRAADLKERVLGAVLFGRPISYETGTDAVVRVRANDVRKRLSSYYETHESKSGWRIQLPLRGYAPRFLPEAQFTDAPETAPTVSEAVARSRAQAEGLPLNLMVMPTLVALFLCAATFRWQIFAGTPYLDFWNSLLAGRSEITFVLDPDVADPHTVALDNLKAIYPLVQTALAFHASEQVQSSEDVMPDRARIVPIHITTRSSLPNGESLPNDPRAAYITVYPGRQPELWIRSSSSAASELAIRSITNTVAFPSALELAMRRSTPSQIRIAEDEQIAVRSLAPGTQQH